MISQLILLATLQVPGNLAQLGIDQNLSIDIRRGQFIDRGRGYRISGDIASESAMKNYSALFTKEWSHYSTSVLKKAKIAKLVFCEKLTLDGQIRAAVPAFGLGAMYYDPAFGAYAPDYQRAVIHHEFFHMLEIQMRPNGSDREWKGLNMKGFSYGDGGIKMRANGAGDLTNNIPGFITKYGTSAVEEDKAELYAHLLVDPRFVAEQASKDVILSSKVELLKRRLKAFDPLFGPSFWPER